MAHNGDNGGSSFRGDPGLRGCDVGIGDDDENGSHDDGNDSDGNDDGIDDNIGDDEKY